MTLEGFLRGEDYQRFARQLQESDPAVFAVAIHYAGKRYEICFKRASVTPSFDERNDGYGEGFDLKVRASAKWVNVECKLRRFPFSTTYPFKKIILDREDKTKQYGFADVYVSVSNDLAYAAFVRASTKDKWWIEPVKDRFKPGHEEREYNCWLCSTDLAEFVALDHDWRGWA